MRDRPPRRSRSRCERHEGRGLPKEGALPPPQGPREKGPTTERRARPGSHACGPAVAIAALILLLVLGGGTAQTVSAASKKKPSTVPGELIVGFKPGVSESEQDAVLAKA